MLISKGKKLFCLFIDYKKAFDLVWREALWYKLLRSSVNGKILSVIKNMYKGIKSYVVNGSSHSDYFASCRGVRQGENLSPLLFSLFINDLEESLIEHGSEYLAFDMENIDGLLRLVVIMYADDTVIIANSATQLKRAMKGLEEYCKNWQLQVNCSKTKIIVFGKSRSRHNSFTLFGETIELVDDYKYLGIMFNYRGNLKKAQSELLKQSYRAMYSLISRGRKLELPFDIMLELFQSLVVPIISYGCEVWGYAMIKEIEILHLKFIKLLLKVKPSTCNAMVYGETGVYPIKIFIYKRMLGFWGRMLRGKSSKLSNVLYEIMLKLYNDGTYEWPWLVFIKKLLDDAGLSYVWYEQREVNVDWLKATIERNLKDQWLQKWNAELQEKSSCSTYRLYKKQYELEPHLMLTNDFRIYTTKLRTNNNKLAVVIGRYSNIPREDRICNICQLNKVGDEYHLFFECNNENVVRLRNKFIPLYYRNRPSIIKFCELISSNKVKLMENIATFLKNVFDLL